MSTHALFIVHRTKPGRRDDAQAVWDRNLRPLIEANEDHVAYFYCYDEVDPDTVRVFQLYRSAEAAAEFVEQPGYLRYLDEVTPLMAGPPELHTALPAWAK